ncbi:hypothetical protein [Pantoea agglomerans]|uniref:hypothetical protein n=1 Tax=Enterobacter agglomerans TaxID=549 RepID=UPI0013B77B31|nr:hypothetical protein [Pantoea agglomerans]NEG59762.1 hypothetical protein [Pantoea agglomerans]NEH00912.1 hypothetical protein [Pantoea agglomerans]NEH05300.1 hypothetical protein [Pantoea agglomerans]NEH16324.1 hypothetical protein [Pantoea agglomerans]
MGLSPDKPVSAKLLFQRDILISSFIFKVISGSETLLRRRTHGISRTSSKLLKLLPELDFSVDNIEGGSQSYFADNQVFFQGEGGRKKELLKTEGAYFSPGKLTR